MRCAETTTCERSKTCRRPCKMMERWMRAGCGPSSETVIHPKPVQKEKLHMRDDVFEFEDIDLIAGGISLQRGKLPEHVITLADEWLLRASKVERRALRARSNPVT